MLKKRTIRKATTKYVNSRMLSVLVYSCNSRSLYKLKQVFITNTASAQHQ